METVKTAVVVVLLLAVLYGVYVVLNKPEFETPPDLAAWEQGTEAPPDIEYGSPQLEAPPTLSASRTTEPAPKPQSAPRPLEVQAELSPTPPADLPPGSGGPTPAAEPAVEPAELTPIAEPEQPGPAGTTLYADVVPQAAAATLASAPAAAERARSVYEQPPAGDTEPASAASPAAGEFPSGQAFDEAWKSAMGQLANQHWAEALLTLSLFYDKPGVTGQQRQRLVDLLDPLAGKVIYSTEHLLEPPYRSRPGETLEQIADSHQVPAALLQNINRLYDPQPLPPGTLVKVVRGPFRAEVQLDKEELVLFLGKFYAGRFAVSVGNDPRPQPGEYRVVGKQQGREYFAPDGAEVAANAPDNPYGNHWLDLGGDVCIHGSPETMPTHGGLGCISLNSTDAADVYGILSVGSKVLVR